MLDKETIFKIKEQYQNGILKKNIAKNLNISLTTISKYTKDLIVEKDDMTDRTFGQLYVLKRLPKNPNLKSRCHRYLCRCSCGKEIEVNGNSLRTGHTTSCGCSRKGTTIKNLLN